MSEWLSKIDLNGPITILTTGLVTVLVDYLRRKMPTDKHDSRLEDTFQDAEKPNPGIQDKNEQEESGEQGV